VSEFYNQVGWHEVSDGLYQNARYEDLRPVSRQYIYDCHMRVRRHLKPAGKYLLDAGSGPIQYPAYLEYSKGYAFRVCADISIVALQEARKRTGEHGLFVVCDIANLPFKPGVFDGAVSLHTIHHLPFEEHQQAYQELYRVLLPGSTAVVVNGWGHASPITKVLDALGRWVGRVQNRLRRAPAPAAPPPGASSALALPRQPVGTFVRKEDPAWLQNVVGKSIPLKIWVWRSVNVGFLRTFIHAGWGGAAILKLIYWLEERFPHFLGKYGNYPLVVLGRAHSPAGARHPDQTKEDQ
jgi:SAM-dependent methyltransferase